MKIADFLRRLRGKITGLDAISARFDILQTQLDRLLTIAGQLNQGGRALPDIEGKLIYAQSGSPAASTSIARASLDSSNDLNVQVVPNHKRLSVIEALPGEKIRLVFLVITPEIWPSIEPVWKKATNDQRFVTSVVVLKSSNPEITLVSLSKAKALLEGKGIPYFSEQTFSLDSYRPHVVFFPLPYGSLYPQSYKPEVVAAMGCRIAYVSYGLEVGGASSMLAISTIARFRVLLGGFSPVLRPN